MLIPTTSDETMRPPCLVVVVSDREAFSPGMCQDLRVSLLLNSFFFNDVVVDGIRPAAVPHQVQQRGQTQ